MAKEPRVWQRMLSGGRLDLLNPSPLDVELDDIAHGLGPGRALERPDSRLPHLLRGAAQPAGRSDRRHLDPALSREWRLAVLLHDAPEYVIGDIISPFKAVIGDAYKAIEERLLGAIHLHFGLPAMPPAALKRFIKRADRQAAFLEATHLAGFGREEATKIFGRPEALSRQIETFSNLGRSPTPSINTVSGWQRLWPRLPDPATHGAYPAFQ